MLHGDQLLLTAAEGSNGLTFTADPTALDQVWTREPADVPHP